MVESEPRIPQDVQKKLLLFTAAILSLPLVTFFSLRQVGANALVSGGSAALVANILLVAYVLVAIFEKDPNAQRLAEKKSK